MIVDYETFIGHFAFRRVPNSSAVGLLRQMDGEGIDKALVSALECVTYRNVQAGNEILAERLAGTHGRLMGAAVVNPAYPRAAEDARRCLTELRMRALRLLPRYHGYRLGEEVRALGCRNVMTVAADLAAPVSITYEIEDDRQHHLLFKPSELAAVEIAAAILTFPDVAFVLERISPNLVRQVERLAAVATNWYVNISGRGMLGATVHLGIADLINWIGPERVLLGTGMTLQYPRAPFLKLESLSLERDALRKIKGENASRLLRLSTR